MTRAAHYYAPRGPDRSDGWMVICWWVGTDGVLKPFWAWSRV